MRQLLIPISAVLLAASLTGCQTDQHAMTKPQPGKHAICTECYEQIQTVRSWPARSGPPRDEVRTTHRCAACQTEMTVYTEGGVLKIRCEKCAPAGMDCDLCAPKS